MTSTDQGSARLIREDIYSTQSFLVNKGTVPGWVPHPLAEASDYRVLAVALDSESWKTLTVARRIILGAAHGRRQDEWFGILESAREIVAELDPAWQFEPHPDAP